MKRHPTARCQWLFLALAASLAWPLPSLAASVALATSPLATSVPSDVKPNILLMMDNSGSMDWDHMPDDASDGGSAVTFSFGYYGLRSSQCNQVYYNPAITYKPPVNAAGTTYSDASFTGAWTNGFNTGAGTVNLNTSFIASQSLGADSSGGRAYFYTYTGTQTTQLQKNYNSTTNTFYSECHSANGATPGSTVFSKRSLSTTETTTINVVTASSAVVDSIKVNGVELMGASSVAGSTNTTTTAGNIAARIYSNGFSATSSGNVITITGPTSAANYTPVIHLSSGSMTSTTDVFPDTTAANLTNFANWYSYYRTRLLMMKTATGRAFSSLNSSFRVGFAKISSSSTPTVYSNTFWNNTDTSLGPVSTQRTDWYAALYAATASGSTPLRTALSDAGRYYAGDLSGTDPVQYSCQQNFTLLSTDGYWNTGNGYKIDGSTAVGNQDGVESRPFYDGASITYNKSTLQNLVSQTQTNQSTSQIQKRTVVTKSSTSTLQRQISQLQSTPSTLQTQTSQLQATPSTLQTQTSQLQKRTSGDTGSTWTSWSGASSCTPDSSGKNQTQCQTVVTSAYATAAGTCTATTTPNSSGYTTQCRYVSGSPVSVSSCTPVAQSAGPSYTVLTARACNTVVTSNYATASGTCTVTTTPDSSGYTTQCRYVTGSPVGVSSCTPVAQSSGSPYTALTAQACNTVITSNYANVGNCTATTTPDSSGFTTQCQYTGWSAFANASSCTAVAQSTGSPYTVGTASQCQITDTGWVGSASCTPSSIIGTTVTCQTINTGPTLVASCTPATASSTNNYTATTCSTTTISSATPTDSCTAGFDSGSGVSTVCTTVTTGPTNVTNCATIAASSFNNWTATTCTAVATTGTGTSNNLADIAMYYYKTDLRTPTLGNCTGALGSDVCENNVFIGGNDSNTQQHMTTFTLGLGASGWMNYSSSYLNDTSGDYYSVKTGALANSAASPPVCSWQADNTTCNWPTPGMDSNSNGFIANIDDLWHAAVNGRGAYFSATDPTTLSAGLSNALAGISSRKGSAAAAATSTLNPVAGDNFAYVASYTTEIWKGNLEARGINTITGTVSENATWCVENVVAGTCSSPGTVVADTSGSTTSYNCVIPNSTTCNNGVLVGTDCKVPVATSCTGTMNAKVAASSDTRTIKTANSAGTALIDFDSAYATANPTNFAAAHINTLSQWTSLTSAQQTEAAGVNLVNFLRGQYGYEDRSANADKLYRAREAVLGDALESQPAFMSKPVFSYPYPGYAAYKTAQAGRAGTVYMGANDGMLHAFAADTGIERWAYVPSMVIPNMWLLADKSYSTMHRNFVNGNPTTSDVCTANCSDEATAVWKTILVAGLNGGGRGYYALDITNPSAPVLLWEFTTTTGIGKVTDDDLGYSFGQPVITQKNDGTWVVLVTSGYNNTSPGTGYGFLYVLNAGTGAIISKIATGAGGTITPSGLARIAAWNGEAAGNKASYVYGGDLLGNVWRFDINSSVSAATLGSGGIGTGAALKFATLYSDSAGTSPQPVTTTPVLGLITNKRVIFIGTGKYLETGDLTTTQKQTQYAIQDDNATSTLVNPRTTLVQQTLVNNPDGTASRIGSTASSCVFSGRGWYVDFPDSKERANIDAQLVQGTLLAPTIVPSSTVCSPGGYGWLNFFNYETGCAVNTTAKLASVKYDSTIVGVNVLYINQKPIVEVVTSTNPTPELPTTGSQPPAQPTGTGGMDPSCYASAEAYLRCLMFTASGASGFTGQRVIWRELIP